MNCTFALVIYAPFLSSDDPRLVNLTDTFARVGFVVGVPWRTDGPYTLDLDEADDIISTLLFLKDNGSLGINHYGLFGISASSGPVMAAATDTRIRDSVDFVVSFAGYYRIENVLRFAMTGQYSYRDIQGKTNPDFYSREILSKVLDDLDCDEESLLTEPRFEQLRHDLSPASFVDQLEAECFIIHSMDDPIIPYTESLWLADVLRERVPVYLCLIDVFEHGIYKKINFANMWRHYLPSFARFYRLLSVLLSKLGGPKFPSA